MKKVLIMAGGTGGHVFPALSIAKAMQAKGIEVHWLGTKRGLESDLVPKANIPISFIQIKSLRTKKFFRQLLTPFEVLYAMRQAMKIIKREKPDVVLGMGGYVSGPGGIAARLLRKPLIIHEQNALAGLTNRVLSWIATTVLEAFPGTFKSSRRQVITVGNPVRSEIADLPALAQRMQEHEKKEPIHVLVLGGSQGALVINQTFPNVVTILAPQDRPMIWHQTGKNRIDEVRRMYQVLGLKPKLEVFIEDMAEAYRWADLVVCRAGAMTVTELMAAGIASVLIPYPHSIDHHQLRNAEYLEQADAAVILPQSEMTSARLAEVLQQLLKNRQKLLIMGENARKLFPTNATEKVIEVCLQAANNAAKRNEPKEEKNIKAED